MKNKIDLFLSITVLSLMFITSCNTDDDLKSYPVLTTTVITKITQNTAMSGGFITSDGGLDVTARGVCWSLKPNPTINDSITKDAAGTGEFTSNVTNLIADTTYYLRAFATNRNGTAYGLQISFKTLVSTLPVLNTNEITDITISTANCGGNITYNGGSAVTARGVCWNTVAYPIVELNNKTTDGEGNGTFGSSITNLLPSTTYFIRAYATNNAGTGYGPQTSFRTLTDGRLPFSEQFEKGIGDFTTQSVSGDQVWEYSAQYKYMSITGYVATVNNANEDWLISPTIDLSSVTAAKLTFDHVARYFADLKNEATVWVSENYVSGLPSTAAWKQLTTKTFTDPGNWTLSPSGEISLTAYAGKKITIAFKYISTATKAGTWEIKNFLVSEGEATTEPIATIEGDGTKTKPYTVADVMLLNPTSTTDAVKTAVWTKGFIVGYYNSTPSPSIVEAVAPFTDDVNIMIAATAGETDKSKMLSIQLPAGAVRTALGLKTTPANIAKEILIYGDILMYNTFPGVKNCSAYWFVASNTGIEPPAAGEFGVPEMSIKDLRAQWTGVMKTITDKKKIVGIVITDLVGGNSTSLKNLTIASSDNSTGIIIRLSANGTYNLGDKIEIALEGLELNQYGQAIQLNNVPIAKIQKIGTGVITAKVTTIADIIANYASYESRLVTVTGTVTSPNGLWGGASHQSNTLTSGTGQLILFVSSYSTFKTTAIPTTEKSITGIIGQNTVPPAAPIYQLIVRNLDDVK